MITYLIVDKLPDEPGIYGVVSSEDDIININEKKSLVNDLLIFTPMIINPYYGIPIAFFKIASSLFKNKKIGRLVKLFEIPNKETLIGKGNDLDIHEEEQIIIHSDFLNKKYHVFEDVIFDGNFKKEEDLKKIIPENQKSELIVITKEVAKKRFTGSETISLGLNIPDFETNSLYSISDFVSNKWRLLTSAIAHIFSNLGAKSIYIKDCTAANINLETKFKKAGIDVVGIDFTFLKKQKFEMKDEFLDSHYFPKEVENKLFLLDHLPNIKQKAKDLILRQRKGKFEFSESLDVSFGLAINVLATFNGVIEGGFERDFDVVIEFN